MPDTFRFPNGGYDVVVCRKQDILDDIEANITDKEVIMAVITQCEVDATNFLKEGRWTGIPYIGNMRIPPRAKKFKELDGLNILKTAKEELDHNRYVVFRKEVNNNIREEVDRERLYKYRTSMFVSKYPDIYKHLLKNKIASTLKDKEAYARFMCYSYIDLTDYIPYELIY